MGIMGSARGLVGMVALSFAAVAPAVPAPAPAAGPATDATAALTAIQPGIWQLRELGSAAPAARNICVMDRRSLIQLRHGEVACTRIVIASDKDSATYHYSCPGAGWGRTSLRVETPRLVRIDTQGIADNAPFAFTAEARRTGDCAGRTKSASR